MPKLLQIALGLALGLARPALAQIAPSSEARQRAANRQALREARRTESPYKDSHLTVTPEQLKRGNTAGPPGVANQPPAPASSGRLRRAAKLRRPAKREPTP